MDRKCQHKDQATYLSHHPKHHFTPPPHRMTSHHIHQHIKSHVIHL